jgi:hypothetical protein
MSFRRCRVNGLKITALPTIDGIGRRADLSLPSIDAIAEMKWTTSGGNAAYPQPTQVVIASRSGTNEFHGSAFEF